MQINLLLNLVNLPAYVLANPLHFKHQSSLKVRSQGNQTNLDNSALTSPKVEHPRALIWWDIQQVDQFIPICTSHPFEQVLPRLISHLYLQSLLQEH